LTKGEVFKKQARTRSEEEREHSRQESKGIYHVPVLSHPRMESNAYPVEITGRQSFGERHPGFVQLMFKMEIALHGDFSLGSLEEDDIDVRCEN
jgi:hypothetical protein